MARPSLLEALFAAATLISSGLPALAADMAADMAVKAPAAATVPSWEGFYVGADAGYGIGITAVNQPFKADLVGSHGFSAGALAGYNHMVAPRWLIGIEADANWSHIDHFEQVTDGFGDFGSVRLAQKDAYSARGRIGYLLVPGTLLYATGGWSWSHLTYALNSNVGAFETASAGMNGPEVGAGVETMIAPNWSARLEYLQAFYRRAVFNSIVLGPIDVRPTVGLARVGLIYHVGPSQAAAPSAPPPHPSWSGFYLGGTLAAGAGTARIDFPQLPGSSINGIGAAGVLPSAVAGYNRRIAADWVVGLEGAVAPGFSTTDFRLDVTEGVHGRFGYLLTPATMVYGTAGWIGSGVRALVENRVSVPSQRVNAAELGAGVETALDQHWTARFEYQYAVAAALNNITVTSPTAVFQVSAHPQLQSVQLGVVYMFAER